MDRPVRPTALAIRHVTHEDLGSLEPWLERNGYTVRYADVGRGVPRDDGDCDLLIVLGGPIGVNDAADFPFIHDEMRLIEKRLAAGRPMLGICLGSQLIAHALGARVYRAPAKEIGFAPISLTDSGRQSSLAPLGDLAVLHWHGDTFDLPADARHLAATEICANQAYAWGERDRVLGVQFHPEITAMGLETWLIGGADELTGQGLSVPGMRQAAARHGAALESAAAEMMRRWLAGVTTR